MPDAPDTPGPGTIRKTVGTPPARTPAEALDHLREQALALGLRLHLPDAHVRKCVGRAQPR